MNTEVSHIENGINPSGFTALANMVLSGPMEEASRRNTRVKIEKFLGWWDVNGRLPFTPELVMWYLGDLKDEGKSATYIGHCLYAVRKLARAAAMRRWIDSISLDGILQLKGPKIQPTRLGQWLTEAKMLEIMALPDRSTLQGKRDYCILGLMLYTGLRCSEVATVEVEHIQIRDGRPALVNLLGKGSKKRSIPMPPFLHRAIEEWMAAAEITTGVLLRACKVNNQPGVAPERMNRVTVYRTVKHYSDLANVPTITPHDLRRTFGRVARKNKAELDQIQQSYGHAHLHTTQQYIGGTLDFANAPCDALPVPPTQKPHP